MSAIHRKQNCRGRGAIYTLAANPHEVRCVTEDQIDVWFASLSAEEKAEIYEQHLTDGSERCRYCGCTEHRACVHDGISCAWLDGNHTVCSAPPCAEAYLSEMMGDVFHGGPQHVLDSLTSELQACGETREFLLANPDVAHELSRAAKHMLEVANAPLQP